MLVCRVGFIHSFARSLTHAAPPMNRPHSPRSRSSFHYTTTMTSWWMVVVVLALLILPLASQQLVADGGSGECSAGSVVLPTLSSVPFQLGETTVNITTYQQPSASGVLTYRFINLHENENTSVVAAKCLLAQKVARSSECREIDALTRECVGRRQRRVSRARRYAQH